jgi:small conductance mechanosensitive channel
MKIVLPEIDEKIFGFSIHEVEKWALKIGTDLLFSIIILVAGFWFANLASKTIRRVLKRSNTDESLVTFLSSLTSTALKLLVVVTSITQFGIQMTSFVALLGAAGLAIGMAFSGTLSNFAGGVMILVFKPFKVGDTILAQTAQGVVKEIQIFNTHIYTPDNKVVILPNGPIANGNITNLTKAENRRVDLIFYLSYGENFEEVKSILLDLFKEDERILQEPEPFVGIGALTTTSLEIHARVWTQKDNHSSVFYAMNEKVYIELTERGFSFHHENSVSKA